MLFRVEEIALCGQRRPGDGRASPGIIGLANASTKQIGPPYFRGVPSDTRVNTQEHLSG